MKTTSQNSKAGTQSRPEQAGTEGKRATLAPIDRERRMANRMLGTGQLLSKLRTEAPRFYEIAQVVGAWVWIQFGERQPSTVTAELSELGFHWNARRTCWQHPCGKFSDGTGQDPRDKYGSYYPSNRQAA